MRKWLALLMGIALVAVAGTALALNGTPETETEKAAPATTVVKDTQPRIETTTTTVEKPSDVKVVSEGMYDEDGVGEILEKSKEPVDEIPPEVTILHPEDGQVFETKEVVFEGTSEPGARVFSGDVEADVDEEGNWRLVLLLDKGENLVTVKAMDESGNYATDEVKVIVELPREEPKEKPKEEPKEKPKEEPKEEKEEPKEEHEEVEWKFDAHQVFGECSENPPYDVFYGTGKPGTAIKVKSDYGSGIAEVNDHGEWELKVFFESAPEGEAFLVKVIDEFGNSEKFEFIHTS